MADALSVVIPTWCELEIIGDAVMRARRIGDEVIVADGGSPDGTARAAEAAGARVVQAAKGRGPQLRAGAEAACGDVLLFLHADTFLDDSARPAIFEALSNRSIIGGNFRVAFVPPSRFGRMVELIYLMLRPLSIYYGDSGIFVRRHVYEEIGGVPPWPLFEDWELVRRLERAGPTCQVRGVVAQTSSRRFEGRALRSLAVWTVLQLLFWAGVPPLQLARRYPDLR